MSRSHGVTEEELVALSSDAWGEVFGDCERAVLEYAAAMTAMPVDIDDALFGRLRNHLEDRQIVELTAAIAWENHRARFNHALQMQAEGFSEGAFCPVPNRPALPELR